MSGQTKRLFNQDGEIREASHINAYLTVGEDIIVSQKSRSLSNFPPMYFGNQPNDGGGLILSVEEYRDIILEYPELVDVVKMFGGSQEFINGGFRYIL
ncbi:Type II restriction enzyme%2C methylase subunit YeeA [Streptococcus pneumoniae]|nr:Type II restriction enzyme%2C methylase subunit YeeA [Streptococcus pneumoniae]CIQ01227.1 Type II restriction enzyme%2C methylase subunit YeeA [Streptococcus pneumoniae]